MTADDELVARARLLDGLAFVRAKLVRGDRVGESKLVATEVWSRDAAASTLQEPRISLDDLYVLRDVHEACGGSSASHGCQWLRAEALGADRVEHSSALDLGFLGGALGAHASRGLAQGQIIAHGARVGSAFVVGAVYVPFPAPRLAPQPGSGTTPPPPVH